MSKQSIQKDLSLQEEPFQGWRIAGTIFGLVFGLLLATIETSITATALVSISDFFGDSTKATWVVLGYLLSYMGMSLYTSPSHGAIPT